MNNDKKPADGIDPDVQQKLDLIHDDTQPARFGYPSTKREKLQRLYDESRNGSDGYTRHGMFRKLIYTDGVRELAETAGAYWLLDVIATEASPVMLAQWETGATLGIVEIEVVGSTAVIRLTTSDDLPPIWTRRIGYTNFPEGTWLLYLGCDSIIEPGHMVTVLCLPSEN